MSQIDDCENMRNVPECFKGRSVVDVCIGEWSPDCQECLFNRLLQVGDDDPERFGEFFNGLETMSGVPFSVRHQDVIML